ncbi:hypothetical protein J6590_050799 [Homalodisca vitripennis]|nr:hypothetical protein J6590_050799 [Homalodisca vitripennis]
MAGLKRQCCQHSQEIGNSNMCHRARPSFSLNVPSATIIGGVHLKSTQTCVEIEVSAIAIPTCITEHGQVFHLMFHL